MKLVFLLMVSIGPTPDNPKGRMVDTAGQYFADVKRCNDVARLTETGQGYSRKRNEPQYKISAWCEPRKVPGEVEVIW